MTTMLAREPASAGAHKVKRIPLRILGMGGVKHVTAEFNGVPFTGGDVVALVKGTPKPGMTVDVGGENRLLDVDLRDVFLRHMNVSASAAVADAPPSGLADGTGVGVDETDGSSTVEELTVVLADDIKAG